MSPIVIKTRSALQEWRNFIASQSEQKLTIGFVPTMGALHEGHASLLKKARKENDRVVLSIFVNPTQFNNPDDLKNYPKTFEADFNLAEREQVDIIFAPETMDEMYPEGYRFKITETEFSKELCGAHRPGHFDGVLTIVMKLFQLIRPNRAYFGEKDHQQLTLVKEMVDSFFLPVEIVAAKTLREKSGLAMSSRNVRLTPAELEIAPKLYEAISKIKNANEAREKLNQLGFKVEYLVDRSSNEQNPKLRRYIAAQLGSVRLIDNVEI